MSETSTERFSEQDGMRVLEEMKAVHAAKMRCAEQKIRELENVIEGLRAMKAAQQRSAEVLLRHKNAVIQEVQHPH